MKNLLQMIRGNGLKSAPFAEAAILPLFSDRKLGAMIGI